MSVADQIRQLFELYPRNATPQLLRAYVEEFAEIDADDLARALANLRREWDRVSLPPVAEIHKRLGTREVGPGRLSASACRALVDKRLAWLGFPVDDENRRAHWEQFAAQLDWPPLEPGWQVPGHEERKRTPADREEGRLIFALAKRDIYWCHEQLAYVPQVETRCRGWGMDRCMRAPQPSLEETREAYAQHCEGRPVSAPRPSKRGMSTLRDELGGMW